MISVSTSVVQIKNPENPDPAANEVMINLNSNDCFTTPDHIVTMYKLSIAATTATAEAAETTTEVTAATEVTVTVTVTTTTTTITPDKKQNQNEQADQQKDKQTSKRAALSLAALSGGDLAWDTWVELVKTFREREGHCNIRKDHLELGCPLGIWVAEQRVARKKLTTEQATKLTVLGFLWKDPKTKAQAWSVLFEKLQMYKEQFGHTSVVYKWDQDPKLANWVTRQRSLFSHNKLSQERQQKLEDLGFVWRIQDDWLVMYEQIKEYKEKYGHCNVPQNWVENPKFGRWVSRQREAFKDGSLKKERKEKLDKVGFEWTLKGKFILVLLGMQDEEFISGSPSVGVKAK